MRLTWHIITKDLRAHRWALLGWAMMFLSQVGLGMLMLGEEGGGEEWTTWMQNANNCLVFLQFATGYLLVAGFVQGDELIGTRMFWVTRPIAPVRLLAAKVLGVLLVFGLGPILLLLPWWVWCGFSARDVGWMALETLGWQLVLIAPAFFLSVLADNIGRVIMWTLVLVAGLAMWLAYLYSKTRFTWLGPNGVSTDVLWLVAVSLMACACLVSIHQFLTRQHVRSIMLAVPTIVLIPVVALGALALRLDWPRAVANLYQPLPKAATDLETVRLSFESAQVRDVYPGGRNGYMGVVQRLHVEGLPADLHIRGQIREHVWTWPDQTPHEQEIRGSFSLWGSPSQSALRQLFSLPESPEDPETARWYEELRERENARRVKVNAERAERGLQPLLNFLPRPLDGRSTLLGGYVTLSDSIARRVRTDPPAYSAKVEVVLTKPEVTLEIPLKSGIEAAADSHAIRILEATRQTDETPGGAKSARVRVIKTQPAMLRNGIWLSALTVQVDSLTRWERLWLTVNRAVGSYERVSGERKPDALQIAGVGIAWDTLVVRPALVVRNGRFIPRDPDWFEHTTLALVPFRPVARFLREVRTEKYELDLSELEKAELEAVKKKSAESF